jgi:hypothetical protein
VWCDSLDWDKMFARQIPSPSQPQYASEYDTGNFDKYPDSDEDTSPPLTGKDKEAFKDF